MGERKFQFVPGSFYHLYNRGNSKQEIFLSDVDYQRFQILLYLCNTVENFKVDHLRKQKVDFFSHERKEKLVAIGAYCLMPNHYHILATPLVENGVSIFMRKLGTGYSMYFNAIHGRTGSLFEGKFKAQLADDDEYLRYLFSYIHLNPLKLTNSGWRDSGVTTDDVATLKAYQYSSLVDYLTPSSRREEKLLDRQPFPDYFREQTNDEHIRQWLSDRKDLSPNSSQ